MKNYKSVLLLLSLQFSFSLLTAQENSLVFNYDAAGNLVERKVQVMAQARMGKFETPKDTTYPFRVFPNPTNNYVNIEGPLPEGKTSADLHIMAINGQVLKTDTYTGHTKAIPVSDLKPGIYLLEIRYSKHQASTYKIIVTN